LERHIGRVGVGVGVRFLKIRVELTGAGATYRQSWSWSWSAIFENRSGVDRSWSGAYPELPISGGCGCGWVGVARGWVAILRVGGWVGVGVGVGVVGGWVGGCGWVGVTSYHNL
jgi:hypothetical protein